MRVTIGGDSDDSLSEMSFVNLRAEIDFDEVSAGNSTDGSSDEKDFFRRRQGGGGGGGSGNNNQGQQNGTNG